MRKKKEIDVDNFKINVVDYSYVVNQKNLSLYVILNIDGIVDVSEKEELKSDNEVLEINKLKRKAVARKSCVGKRGDLHGYLYGTGAFL